MIQRKIIIGTSGATLIRGRRATLKIHGAGSAAKLMEQAEYMRAIGPPFARVRGLRDGRYATPTLQPLQGPVADRLIAARHSLSLIWAKPATLPDDWQGAHWRYVAELCTLHRLPWLQTALYKQFFYVVVPWPGPVCATHGDATLDNMLMDGRLPAWIDPIPPSGKVPPFLAVDLGKLFQSARGYERAKYDSAWPEADAHDTLVALSGFAPVLKVVARYWYLVHLLRLLRYATPRIKNFAMEELNALCV